ncbi:MAG TPA: DUF222 domain-containing protein, partial [Actinomycetes bacterium]|nr:DUF222 domain-containing protein [Actinomycetes bacterium]
MAESTAPTSIDQQFRALIESMPAVDQITDDALRDRLVELERVVNTAHAAQAEVMTEIAARAGTAEYEFIADELAITLTCTKPVASQRFADALHATQHPALMAAWHSGHIDSRKVHTLCTGLVDASPVAKDTLIDAAVAYATTHTPPELRRWLGRRVIAADPDAAEAQHRRALADRRITVTPLGNGLSEFMALLPSIQARQIYDTANAIAHTFDHTDVRTMDQRRTDAFVDLVIGRAEPPHVNLNVTVPLDVLEGDSQAPAMVSGIGAVPSSQLSEWIDSATIRRLLTEPTNGYLVDVTERQYRPSRALDRAIRQRDQVCRFPGCSRPATTTRSG